MSWSFHTLGHNLAQLLPLRKHATVHENPAMTLAQNFTGQFAFLDEQTNKTHSLAISPELTIRIDRKVLPGQVVGVTISQLIFLDHFGYKLVITADENGPQTIYDEAENATYAIIASPNTEQNE